jgi:alkanesulfonate monooxygenase SsuD/methylene tetrahydromethanopterin reductase-like flavin-dependent oxidoreductase (luciferase family)
VTPADAEHGRTIVEQIRAEQAAAGRAGETVHIFGDLVVFLDETAAAAAERKARLDDRAGAAFTSDAHIFTGTPKQLADLLLGWRDAGLTGFRLRPGVLGDDLEAITRGLVPQLRSRGVFRREYEASSLRGLLGLPRPANRYANS